MKNEILLSLNILAKSFYCHWWLFLDSHTQYFVIMITIMWTKWKECLGCTHGLRLLVKIRDACLKDLVWKRTGKKRRLSRDARDRSGQAKKVYSKKPWIHLYAYHSHWIIIALCSSTFCSCFERKFCSKNLKRYAKEEIHAWQRLILKWVWCSERCSGVFCEGMFFEVANQSTRIDGVGF